MPKERYRVLLVPLKHWKNEFDLLFSYVHDNYSTDIVDHVFYGENQISYFFKLN